MHSFSHKVVTVCIVLHNISEEKGHEVCWQKTDGEPLLIPFSKDSVQALDRWQKPAGTAVWEALADCLFSRAMI